jgi:hypothetical protein
MAVWDLQQFGNSSGLGTPAVWGLQQIGSSADWEFSRLGTPEDWEPSKGHQQENAQPPRFLLPVGSRAGFHGRPGPGHVPLGDGEQAQPGRGPLRRDFS